MRRERERGGTRLGAIDANRIVTKSFNHQAEHAVSVSLGLCVSILRCWQVQAYTSLQAERGDRSDPSFPSLEVKRGTRPLITIRG